MHSRATSRLALTVFISLPFALDGHESVSNTDLNMDEKHGIVKVLGTVQGDPGSP